jgi:HAD superfamily hydrolase (TIGR01509 family)
MRRQMFARLLWAGLQNPYRGFHTMRILSSYRRAQETLRDGAPQVDLEQAQQTLAAEWSGRSEESVRETVENWTRRAPLDLLAQCRYDGVPELFEAARTRGVAVAALSDYPPAEKLQALGLASHFRHVISAQDPEVGRFKPHPRGLEVALERLGVSAADAVYVGDRPEVDGMCAERAGVRCAIVGAEASGTSWVGVRGFRELASLLWPAQ